ncbi:EAL domain-containing protein [Kineococcus sp. T13]|uniref:putative bifunctional diguanylate cyclase/phosphodiesterase n=1 Tax=Kineococcus vitellinus TaxID=2696565 RepID=UPI001412D991|nr:bifunctional diguanylate cyclase/phosphodiesterase [Kineococcus vitellinus]NAZ74664.1 EAL domain-containing protein [Kineococcus vitellinus]
MPTSNPVARSTGARPARALPLLAAVLAAVLAAGLAAASVAAHWWPVLAALARTGCFAATALLLRRSARRAGAEGEVWRWAALAATAVCAGSALDALERALEQVGTVPPGAHGTAFAVATLLACPLVYRGLIVWNRLRTATTDPGDWLNGLSATLALAALGNLLLSWRGDGRAGLPWGEVQLLLFQAAALVVVLGTTVTVATMGDLLRDPRPWAVAAGALVALAGVVPWNDWSGSAGWLVLLAALAAAGLLPVRASRPQAATTQSLTIGALVVLLAGVAILVANTRLEPARTSTSVLWAVLAVVGVSTRVVNLIRDLSSLAVRRQEALTDELTGLANRRAFSRRLEELARLHRPVALLVLDLDRFKEVNDRFGHGVGDELLRALAARLRAAAPPEGLLARLGGDEFAVVLPGASPEAAARSARQLVRACRAPLDAGAFGGAALGAALGGALGGAAAGDPADPGPRLELDVSIGVAATPALADGGELLRRADAAMYVAKTGRTGVSTFDEEIDERARERARLADELVAALAPGQDERPPFPVHYQPQVSAATGEVTGVEALVRWQHPRAGLLPPAAFLDLVEQRGLVERLTRHVLRVAAADAASWRAQGLGRLRTSVNLSATCLADPALVPELLAVLPAGSRPSDVVLEVTETMLMTDPGAALEVCRAVTAAGFGLSIDDYGTGYSSLAYLSDLPASELKIDRSFTARLVQDARVGAIIAGTVELGHRLGLRVVAEGAEDEATLAALRGLGCDEVQGFVHARPLPAGDLAAWLRSRPRPSAPPAPPAPVAGAAGAAT